MYLGFVDMNLGFLIIIAAMVLGLVAKSMVSNTYRKFSRVSTGRGVSGAGIAREILDSYGLANIDIQQIAGQLSDHYDPRNGVLKLSQSVYNGNSVASVGVAAHEAGHAVQDAMGYSPFQIRQKLVPVASLGSQMLFPLIIGGLFFRITELYYIGAALYGAALLFQLVTLPVEFDASRRAVVYLRKSGNMSGNELAGVKKVLTAASLTYVAAALASLGQMIWLVLAGRRR
ncbi:MAG: peptidase [Candidatus Aegiribacteria sp.]|nr:peptidase [Candidatus Aegiribacteria sp.]MBD3294333.1 peptidase [Candidatus Fermentibacteria bacterium]